MSKNKFTFHDSVHDTNAHMQRNKKARLANLNPNVSPIPLFEMTDQFASSASAVNAGLDFEVVPFKIDSTPNVSEESLRYQLAGCNFRGGRLIGDNKFPFRYDNRSGLKLKKFRVDEDHFLNVASEAQHGYRNIGGQTRNVFASQQSVTDGASNHSRSRGLEEQLNPSIYPEIAQSVDFRKVQTNVPNEDVFRFNDVTVDQIISYPMSGF